MRILNSELADTLGNLLSRGCAKSVNVQQVFPALDVAYFHDDLMKLDVTKKLVELVAQLPGKYNIDSEKISFHSIGDVESAS